MTRSELARNYWRLHRCDASVLRDRYKLSIGTAKTIIQMEKAQIKVDTHREQRKIEMMFGNIEDQIKGLDHTYNPERDINWCNVKLY